MWVRRYFPTLAVGTTIIFLKLYRAMIAAYTTLYRARGRADSQDTRHEERYTWYRANALTAPPSGGRSHSGTGTAEPSHKKIKAQFLSKTFHTHKKVG